MGKRILTLFLALCLLIPVLPISDVFAKSTSDAPAVVYIPLDDRPFNDRRVQLMADTLNIDLIMPEQDLYATKLDGQELNSNGTQYGNREALLTWLQEVAPDYDVFILSLDQLLSGGLMNSRCMSEMQALELADGSTLTEYEVIDYLAELAQDKEVYIIDSVMRLATSCDYGGYNLTHYNIFRTYGAVGRPVLSGSELTVANIINNYAYASDGYTKAYTRSNLSADELSILLSPMDSQQDTPDSAEEETAYLKREEPAYTDIQNSQNSNSSVAAPVEAENSLLSDYLEIRARKLQLTNYAMQQLCGLENVSYLLGVDDSSEGNNIQRNEIALFQSYLDDDNDQLFSALDGLGQVALSKIFFSQYPVQDLNISVTYLGDQADQVLSYNCYTPRQIMDQAIAYFGGTQDTESPDLSVIAITNSKDNTTQTYCSLISLLNENEAAGLPTILVDLTSGQGDTLNTLLVENTHLGMLLSYSGQSEIPNGIIMALSQGLSRYQALATPDFQTDETQSAHILNLSYALINEFGFLDGAYEVMDTKLSDLGLSSRNFGSIDAAVKGEIFQALTDSVTEASAPLLDNLSSSNFITGLSPYTTASIQDVSIDACSYPWLRQMEVNFTLSKRWSETSYSLGTLHQSYINGITDTTFAPNENVTRDQTAKLLVSAVGLTPETPTSDAPEDVAQWAWPYVSLAMDRGYIKGYPDNSFRGNNSITRAEFVSMVIQYVQAEGIELTPQTTVSFSDVEDTDDIWYNQNIYMLARAGIINGYLDGTFQPEAYISRAEAVTILNRLTNRTESLSPSLLAALRFQDVTAEWQIPQIQEGSISHFCAAE